VSGGNKRFPKWPLALIAAPAGVSVWSGWVGLGEMCGFGIVHPLPGIVSEFQLNTAITLPVGVEAYGAYALGAWLTPGVAPVARKFARRSAIGALMLGMTGQVIYHLLSAAHAVRAPSSVVVLVSCLPVVTLGFGAALTHLLRAEPEPEREPADVPGVRREPEPVPGTRPEPEPVPGTRPEPEPVPGTRPEPEPVPRALPTVYPELVPVPGAYPETQLTAGTGAELAGLAEWPTSEVGPPEPGTLNRHAEMAAWMFAADLEAGRVPLIRTIRTRMQVGPTRARQVQAYLRTRITTPGQEAS
jgi:hypothetical protein